VKSDINNVIRQKRSEMKKAIQVLPVVFIFVLGGCVGSLVPVVKLDKDSAMRLRKEIRVFDIAELQNKEYRRLGQIEATSCMNKLWDSPASKEDAIDQLRYKASALGGNGITNLFCEKCEGTDLAKNCWNSVTCYGVAIALGPAGEESPKGSQETTKSSGSGAVPIDHELVYDEKTKRGYISVKGKGLEARPWMIKQIEAVCSSKNIVIQGGTEPEPAYYRILDEKLQNGKFTIEFEVVR
jgi:hypothetical protein